MVLLKLERISSLSKTDHSSSYSRI